MLVFNNKIDEMRQRLDIFIPFTDNKGPVTRFNLNRFTLQKYKSNFYTNKVKPNKISNVQLNYDLTNYNSIERDDTNQSQLDIDNNLITNQNYLIPNEEKNEIPHKTSHKQTKTQQFENNN